MTRASLRADEASEEGTRVTSLDRRTAMRVAAVWLGSRLIVFVSALAGLAAAGGAIPSLGAYVEGWFRWDAVWYASVAEYGYLIPDLSMRPEQITDFSWNGAFFPGLPGLMWLGGQAGLSPSAVGLIAAAAASLVAALALARLARSTGASSTVTTLVWLIAPPAVFLTAPYTEALFCAFAFWAWERARERQWVWAGLLASGAAIFRSNGLFLAIGLVVLFLTTRPRDWRRGAALLLPFLVTLAFFAYLANHTGRITAWFDMHRLGWSRDLTVPWETLANSVDLVFTYNPDGSISTRFIAEIVAVALLAVFTVIVLWRRWWGEGVFMLVTLASLATSSWYYSVPRALVVMFPMWIVIGLWCTRRRWLLVPYAAVSLPLLILVSARFVQNQWIS